MFQQECSNKQRSNKGCDLSLCQCLCSCDGKDHKQTLTICKEKRMIADYLLLRHREKP